MSTATEEIAISCHVHTYTDTHKHTDTRKHTHKHTHTLTHTLTQTHTLYFTLMDERVQQFYS